MTNENFIPFWEKTLQEGKTKFLFKQFIRFLLILLIGNLLITQFIFEGSSVIDYFRDSNWSGLYYRLGIWIVACLGASYLQFWSYNKKYIKLKNAG